MVFVPCIPPAPVPDDCGERVRKRPLAVPPVVADADEQQVSCLSVLVVAVIVAVVGGMVLAVLGDAPPAVPVAVEKR